ncbi:MAG: hypothetical protein ACP5NV_01210 [Candidatus Woesearchaeota archaeon]
MDVIESKDFFENLEIMKKLSLLMFETILENDLEQEKKEALLKDTCSVLKKLAFKSFKEQKMIAIVDNYITSCNGYIYDLVNKDTHLRNASKYLDLIKNF